MNYIRLFFLFFIAFYICTRVQAQSSISRDTTVSDKNANSLNTSSKKLAKSISDDISKDEIAEDYFNLGQELAKKGDYIKAETYVTKAIHLAKGNKKNNRTASYYRELAKIQEALNKTVEAAESYEKASALSTEKEQQQINSNDANRARYGSSPELELQYLNQNSQILSSGNNSKERAQTYTQIANVNRSMNQTDQALENYKNALTEVDSQSDESIIIKSNMADLLAETKNYDQAINLQKEVVEQTYKTADAETQAHQMRQLSDIYFASNSKLEGLNVLKDAYKLAMEKGNLKEAKASLESLVDFYEKSKESQQVLKLYKDFISHLEILISKDNSLVDIKLFQVTEEKISRLEKEKTLKDELIERKNKFNLMLIVSVFLLLVLIMLVVKAWFSIKKRNKQIALQSLRREMNPHFIFNSLNSVNQYIANNNELEANKYLTSYSQMMRKMMENSNKDYVSLGVEIEQLSKYLELEKLRFPDKFEYTLTVDPSLDTELVKVPNMIIQPNLENAIWHGLRYKKAGGQLSLKFIKESHKTVVIIEDNGIGLKESREIKTKNQKLHESRGLKNVQERIRLLNDIYNTHIYFEINEKTGNESGVIVKIEWR